MMFESITKTAVDAHVQTSHSVDRAAQNSLYLVAGDRVTVHIELVTGEVRELTIDTSGQVVLVTDADTGDCLCLKPSRNFAVIGEKMMQQHRT